MPFPAAVAGQGHGPPGVEGMYSDVTVVMEARFVEYLRGVWEKEEVGAGFVDASFSRVRSQVIS